MPMNVNPRGGFSYERGFRGVKGDLGTNIRKLIDQFPWQVMAAARAEVEIESKEAFKLTPWKTHRLQRTNRIIEPGFVGNTLHTGIAAGDESTVNYDVVVHEDTEMLHPRGGEDHFLSKPWLAAAPHLLERIARRLDLHGIIAR